LIQRLHSNIIAKAHAESAGLAVSADERSIDMKAAVLAGPRSVEITDVDVPQPGPGEALVRMRNVGICGSDLHFFRGEFPLPPGFILGHECSGEVEALGEGVTGFQKGDRVAVEGFKVCLACAFCRTGRYQHCPSRKAFGLNAPGGLREYQALPTYTLYKLPDAIDFELGALLEPLTVSVHGLRLVDVKFGDRVAVLGSGSIGLTAIAAARAMGATYVAATARHAQQRAMAEALGADAVYDATNEGAAKLAAAGGFDVVVETVGGHAETLGQALQSVAINGRISVLGAFTQPVQIHPIMLFLKEPTIVGSNCYGRPGRMSDYEMSIEIMRRDPETMRRLITHRFPLDDIAKAYETADDKSTGAIKVMVAQ
jgi:2-desacetyl-2-hydroxyethyl bacteriochlorophyllide A dehydrogenase